MDKKLAVAQFGAMTDEQVKMVVEKFASAFPSLDGIAEVTPELLHFCKTGEYSPKIQDVIDAASYDDEWPASVKLSGENHYGEWEIFELVITPYTGDRHLRIRHSGAWRGCGWEWFIECDYRDRPSVFAAEEVIEFLESKEYYDAGLSKWNDPEFVEA